MLANLTEFGKTPMFTGTQLGEVGIRLVLYPLSAFRAMSKAAEEVYQTIREEGTARHIIEKMQTREQLYKVLGYKEYESKLDQLFFNQQGTTNKD